MEERYFDPEFGWIYPADPEMPEEWPVSILETMDREDIYPVVIDCR